MRRRRPGAALLGALLLAGSSAGEEPASPPEAAFAPCVACEASLAPVRATYSEEAWQELARGEVVTTHAEVESPGEGVERRVVASGLVERPPAQVWAVLLDFPSHRHFFPNVQETRVRRWEGRRIWIAQHLKVLFTDIRFGAIWTLEPEAGRARFALDESVPHDIAASRGSWELVPVDGGRHTLVRYAATVDTGRPVPGVVERMLTRRSLPRVVQGLRQAVHARHPPPDGGVAEAGS